MNRMDRAAYGTKFWISAHRVICVERLRWSSSCAGTVHSDVFQFTVRSATAPVISIPISIWLTSLSCLILYLHIRTFSRSRYELTPLLLLRLRRRACSLGPSLVFVSGVTLMSPRWTRVDFLHFVVPSPARSCRKHARTDSLNLVKFYFSSALPAALRSEQHNDLSHHDAVLRIDFRNHSPPPPRIEGGILSCPMSKIANVCSAGNTVVPPQSRASN